MSENEPSAQKLPTEAELLSQEIDRACENISHFSDQDIIDLYVDELHAALEDSNQQLVN